MWDVMGNICDSPSFFFLEEPKLGNNMENIWVICGKYVRNIYVSPK